MENVAKHAFIQLYDSKSCASYDVSQFGTKAGKRDRAHFKFGGRSFAARRRSLRSNLTARQKIYPSWPFLAARRLLQETLRGLALVFQTSDLAHSRY